MQFISKIARYMAWKLNKRSMSGGVLQGFSEISNNYLRFIANWKNINIHVLT